MRLYSYQFLIQNMNNLNYVFLFAMILFIVLLIFSGLNYLRHRTNLKFRDLFILVIFISLLLMGLQWHNIELNGQNNRKRTAHFIQEISLIKKVPVREIASDSKILENGMTLKVKDKFYNVTFNRKRTSYNLTQTRVVNPKKINYVTHQNPSFSLFDSRYLDLGLKLLLGFAMLAIQINLSGKSTLVQSTVIDQMQNYVLGSIVGVMIYLPNITILEFTIILLLWSIIVFAVRILSRNNKLFKRFLIGHPTKVIKNGLVNVDALLRNGMSADDLLFNLREHDAENFRKVTDAEFERNGSLTVHVDNENDTYSVIVDGHLNKQSLKESGLSYDGLEAQLIRRGKQFKIDQVFLAQVTDGKVSFVLYPQLSKHELRRWLKESVLHEKDNTDRIKSRGDDSYSENKYENGGYKEKY